MEKINFNDLPNTDTPINSSNLNQLQTNVENAINGVVESGSNANGSYIKYADGTMMCYGNASGTSTLSDYWGAFERTATITVTYPVGFVARPTMDLTLINSWRGEVSAFIETNSATSFGFQILKCNGATDGAYNMYWMAIGRWK